MSDNSVGLFRAGPALEELNSVYVKISQADPDRKPKSIVIAGCHEGEGASTIAVNLSQIFAKKSEGRILLVDANLRNGGLEDVFHAGRIPGLTNLLMGQADVKAAIRETRLANLAFLPAGSRRTDLKAVFDPEAISSCLEGLKQTFRFIFIDAPPLIPYADSLVLSSRADIVLLVLEADKTRLEVAREAVRRLSKMNISVFGTILNKKTFRIPSLIYKRL